MRESVKESAPCEKNWCMEMKTMVTPIKKLIVREWPNSAADMMPVKIVAIVDEYFLRMVSAYLKKKEDRMPCSALFNTSNIVTCAHSHASEDWAWMHKIQAAIGRGVMP